MGKIAMEKAIENKKKKKSVIAPHCMQQEE